MKLLILFVYICQSTFTGPFFEENVNSQQLRLGKT